MSWYPESLKGGYILKMSYLRYLSLVSIVLFLISSPAVFADGGKISGLILWRLLLYRVHITMRA